MKKTTVNGQENVEKPRVGFLAISFTIIRPPPPLKGKKWNIRAEVSLSPNMLAYCFLSMISACRISIILVK